MEPGCCPAVTMGLPPVLDGVVRLRLHWGVTGQVSPGCRGCSPAVAGDARQQVPVPDQHRVGTGVVGPGRPPTASPARCSRSRRAVTMSRAPATVTTACPAGSCRTCTASPPLCTRTRGAGWACPASSAATSANPGGDRLVPGAGAPAGWARPRPLAGGVPAGQAADAGAGCRRLPARLADSDDGSKGHQAAAGKRAAGRPPGCPAACHRLKH
jgi:hypothetical protein